MSDSAAAAARPSASIIRGEPTARKSIDGTKRISFTDDTDGNAVVCRGTDFYIGKADRASATKYNPGENSEDVIIRNSTKKDWTRSGMMRMTLDDSFSLGSLRSLGESLSSMRSLAEGLSSMRYLGDPGARSSRCLGGSLRSSVGSIDEDGEVNDGPPPRCLPDGAARRRESYCLEQLMSVTSLDPDCRQEQRRTSFKALGVDSQEQLEWSISLLELHEAVPRRTTDGGAGGGRLRGSVREGGEEGSLDGSADGSDGETAAARASLHQSDVGPSFLGDQGLHRSYGERFNLNDLDDVDFS